jgi:hypothetical protein
MPGADSFSTPATTPGVCLWVFLCIREHNRVSERALWCCVYEKNVLSGLPPFRGRLSGVAVARSCALRARQPPDYRCLLFLASMISCLLPFVGRPDPGYAPSQFIPFDPFLSGGMYCSAPHRVPALQLSLVGAVVSPASASAHARLLRLDAGGVLLLDVAGWRTAARFRIAWTAI